MGRKTHGPYLVSAVENNDIKKVSDILSTKFRDKTKVKIFLTSEVKRLASDYVEVPLLLAASLEDPTIIKYMVQKHDVNINYIHEYGFQKPRKRKTALLAAVKKGLYVTVDTILSLNADVNIQDHKDRTPLHHAIRRADYRMVKLLLSRGAQVTVNDITGNSPLHVATIYGHLELVKLLLKYGGDLYKKGQCGAIPIHIAAREGHSHVITSFCESYEVNPDIKVPCYDELEKTPLHVAASRGHAETVHTLLTICKAEINLQDSEGNTALHYCVLNDYDPLGMKSKEDFVDTVKTLLNFGAIVNLQNGRGETALHLSARNEFQKVTEILVLAGCDPLIEDNDKNKAFDLVADDDTVSKQTLKNAIANRDKILHESEELRAQGFQTNFQREKIISSSKSNSMLNVNGAFNLSSNKLMHFNYGSQNYMPNFVNVGSHSSSNSSNKYGYDNMLSESRLLPVAPEREHLPYSRRTKSVEDLDSHKKLKKKQKYDAIARYNRKNSYQDSEVTSMWSVTPPGSVQDFGSEKSGPIYDKKKNKKHGTKNKPETIMENQEYKHNARKNTCKIKKESQNYDSDDYFLDDESIDVLDEDYNFKKSNENVKKWMDKSKNHYKNLNNDSNESEFDSDDTSSYESKRSEDEIPKKQTSHYNRPSNKKSNVEQIIELDASRDDDQTTIRFIPMSDKKTGQKNISKQTTKPMDSHSKNSSSELKNSKNNSPIDINKPVPKKRANLQNPSSTNKILDNSLCTDAENLNGVKPNQVSSPNIEKVKKLEKPTVPKKVNSNLVFTKAIDQSLDNTEHSNLARISAGDSAIPTKPTYSSNISSTLSNSYLDNSSRSLQHLQNKLTSNNENTSIEKSFETNESNNDSMFDSTDNNLNNQRIVSFSMKNNLPFTIVGGNETGVFVDTVDRNSTAFKNGLSSGDKILKINNYQISDKTKEEIDHYIRQIKDIVTLVVIKETQNYIKIVKNGGSGDLIYLKSHFKSEAKRKGDLDVKPGNIFKVIDTMPNGNPGFYKAKLVTSKEADLIEGLIPNEYRAEQEITKEKLLSNDSSMNERGGTFFRSFRRSKSTDRNNKDTSLAASYDKKDLDENYYTVYERVETKLSIFRRPVVILGLFCDVVINKLVKENSLLFDKPDGILESAKNSDQLENIEKIQKSLNNNKHLLIILSPTSLEYILNNTNLNPIVIYLAPVSKNVVKSVKMRLAPNYMKDAGYMYEEAIKFEKNYSELFTQVVEYTQDEWWYHNLKEAINNCQKQPIWQNVDAKNDLVRKNEQDSNVYRSVKNSKQSQKNRISRTTEDLPDLVTKEAVEKKNANTKKTSQNIKPEVPQKFFHAKTIANSSKHQHETPL